MRAAAAVVRDALDPATARIDAYVVPIALADPAPADPTASAVPAVLADPADPASGTAALRDWLVKRLPAHLVPATLTHVPRLPLTPNGKLDPDRLPPPARDTGTRPAAEAPGDGGASVDGDAPADGGASVDGRGPADSTGRALAGVWQDVLGCRWDRTTTSSRWAATRCSPSGSTPNCAAADSPRASCATSSGTPPRAVSRPSSARVAGCTERSGRDRIGHRGRRRGPRPAGARRGRPGEFWSALVAGRVTLPSASASATASTVRTEPVAREDHDRRPGVAQTDRPDSGQTDRPDSGQTDRPDSGRPTGPTGQTDRLGAGQIDRFAQFDAELFRMPPAHAAATDPQHRVLTELVWEALEDAGIDTERTRDRVGIFAGCGTDTYLHDHVLTSEQTVRALGREQISLGNSRDYLATGVASRLGFTGPAVTVQSACSTSLVAVHQAVRSLLTYECDIAVAGAVSIHPEQDPVYTHAEGGITSPDGRCRAFTQGSRGTVPSSGGAVVVLRRVADMAAGERVRGRIVGSAVNNDGADRMSLAAPSPRGQAEVLREALDIAGLPASGVGFVETHGTGTALGDQIELAALAEVYGTAPRLALGAVKANIGHCDTASGVIGLIKAVLAMEHRMLPPTPSQPGDGPDADLGAAGFFLPRRCEPWPADLPTRTAVSSFGLGGTNAHVVLEPAHPAPADRPAFRHAHRRAVRRDPRGAAPRRRCPAHLADRAGRGGGPRRCARHPVVRQTGASRAVGCGAAF